VVGGLYHAEVESRFSVYLLRCRDGSLYAGITTDLQRRLLQHNAGKGAAYTRSRRPVTLVYQEASSDRSSALKREAALRRLDRAQKLALIEEKARRRTKRARRRH
jgi:putative endonuclease